MSTCDVSRRGRLTSANVCRGRIRRTVDVESTGITARRSCRPRHGVISPGAGALTWSASRAASRAIWSSPWRPAAGDGCRRRLPGRDLGARPAGPVRPRRARILARTRDGERARALLGRAPGWSAPVPRRLFALPPGRPGGRVTAAARSLAPGQVVAAVDAAAGNGQALRSLAAARDVLADGAPPGVGRLVTELIARGSAEFTAPACKSCGTTGRPLTRSSRGGVCPGCRNRLLAVACGRCGGVKPVAVRTDAGEPVCERCRRHERGHRPCGTCRTCGKRPGQVWHDETADLGRHVFRKLSSLADAVAERDYCKRGWPTL